jgi:[ribosomal protein S18]-alanine N-acetyltransferase
MSRTDLIVERLQENDDIDAVVDLEARCFTNPWTRDMLVRELAQSDVAHVYVLRLPGHAVAAFCTCWIVADELHINTIAVDPAHRRQGIATHLIRRVMREAALKGAVRATLEVRSSNTPARRLYERLGFQVARTRRQYYSHPDEDALILWKHELTDLDSPDF